jgi:hypothetical protein
MLYLKGATKVSHLLSVLLQSYPDATYAVHTTVAKAGQIESAFKDHKLQVQQVNEYGLRSSYLYQFNMFLLQGFLFCTDGQPARVLDMCTIVVGAKVVKDELLHPKSIRIWRPTGMS